MNAGGSLRPAASDLVRELPGHMEVGAFLSRAGPLQLMSLLLPL